MIKKKKKKKVYKIPSHKLLLKRKKLPLISKVRYSGFKKNYFKFSEQHQKYIDFDKKNYTADGNFLYSKFVTYINVIPYSRAPFFFALYLGMVVPQLLFLFRRMRKDGSYTNILKLVAGLTFLIALVNLFYWFFDLFVESNRIGKHNLKINASISYGFNIFMLSEVCIFAGLFWGFFDRAFHPDISVQSVYMPSGTHGLPTLGLVFKGSLLLSSSCVAYHAMKRSLQLGENNKARIWGFISLCIGLWFLFQQGEEYANIPFMMSLNAHCSFFYAITGLHGFHVAVGLLLIGTVVDRIEQEKFNQYDLMSVKFTEIYWVFVDVIWFGLLGALYGYGIYHPNCVLYEKHTLVEDFEVCSYIVDYLYFSLLQIVNPEIYYNHEGGMLIQFINELSLFLERCEVMLSWGLKNKIIFIKYIILSTLKGLFFMMVELLLFIINCGDYIFSHLYLFIEKLLKMILYFFLHPVRTIVYIFSSIYYYSTKTYYVMLVMDYLADYVVDFYSDVCNKLKI